MVRVMLGVNELVVGGGPVLARNWTRILNEAGHETLIVGGEGRYAEVLQAEGYAVRVIPHLSNGGPVAGAREVVAELASWEPDIFVSQHLRGDVVAEVLPSVAYSINVCRSQFRRRELLAEWARDGRVGTCDATFIPMMEAVLGQRVRMLRLPASEVTRTQRQFSNQPVIGTVGRLCAERVSGVVAAVRDCVEMGLEMRVVGAGEIPLELFRETFAGGCDSIELLGEVYPAPFGEFDIHIAVGGMSCLEGALAGVPTVVWDIYNEQENVGREAAGILGPGVMSPNGVSPVLEYKPASFTHYIEKIMSMSDGEREEIVEAARQYVLEEHVVKAGEEFLDFLRLI